MPLNTYKVFLGYKTLKMGLGNRLITTPIRGNSPACAERLLMPNAAWAWEFLRRNKLYQRDFAKAFWDSPDVIELVTGSRLVIAKKRYQKARDWGLVCFADPDYNALETEVVWKPSAFNATVRVKLGDLQAECESPHSNFGRVEDSVILSELRCHRVLYESMNKSRHIVLNTPEYWFQLYCDTVHPSGDKVIIRFRIDGGNHSLERMKTIAELIDLAHSSNDELSQLGTQKTTQMLQDSIIALDIKKDGGSYKAISCALVGEKRTIEEWDSGNCVLKDKARRALAMGRRYRDYKYLSLLG